MTARNFETLWHRIRTVCAECPKDGGCPCQETFLAAVVPVNDLLEKMDGVLDRGIKHLTEGAQYGEAVLGERHRILEIISRLKTSEENLTKVFPNPAQHQYGIAVLDDLEAYIKEEIHLPAVEDPEPTPG